MLQLLVTPIVVAAGRAYVVAILKRSPLTMTGHVVASGRALECASR